MLRQARVPLAGRAQSTSANRGRVAWSVLLGVAPGALLPPAALKVQTKKRSKERSKGFRKVGARCSPAMLEATVRPPSVRSIGIRALYVLVAAVASLALAGGGLAVVTLRGAPAAAKHDHRTRGNAAPRPSRKDDIGRSIPTSFGVIAVESVQKLRGLTAKQLSGVTHFPSYVSPQRMQVQVFVELTNMRPNPVRYSPRQFRLRVGSGRPVPITAASIPGGTLQPSASIDGLLNFVAPRVTRSGPRVWLEFRDPGKTRPVRFDLGPARTRGQIGANAPHDHHLAPP